MANGLSGRVPTGWAGDLVSSSPATDSPFLAFRVSESLTLNRNDQETHPNMVVLFSAETTAPLPSSFHQPHELAAASPTLFAYMQKGGTGPNEMYLVETAAPGASRGLIVFEGPRSDPSSTVAGIWQLLSLSGASLAKP